MYLLTGTGGAIKLDGLGGVLTSHMRLQISPDDDGKLPLSAPNE